ncbi:MAG TPA: sigma 54-interacting transcriptional regulator [Bryobacteraceae bacterium]
MTPQTALDSSPLAKLLGASPAIRKVHRLVTRMSKSRFPVLIQGETGTGKEVAARAIHDLEPRGQFVVVDCSALVGPIMESELFGYAKGAFTGAHNQKLGLLDAANGGTAFFDEIGELPLDLQMKLLRVLQEKQFRPVGGLAPRSSNFRILAATNRDLGAEAQAGRFREDLYYRLNVMKLCLPPLRERKEDVPVLIGHFLQQYGNGHHITDDVMQALVDFDWPGNVRQLEHTVQQIIAMNSGPWITAADLPSAVVNRRSEKALNAAAASPYPGDPQQEVIPLAELEKRAILHALERAKHDRTLAAVMLGIGRTTLYRKLKSYGL